MENTITIKDILQICPNGHVITLFSQAFPQTKKSHCTTCGEATITRCEKCGNPITGGIVVIDRMYNDREYIDTSVPDFCEHCGSVFPWASLKKDPILLEPSKERERGSGNQVFVVHGHNVTVKGQVEEFLTRCGLAPIVLQQQPNLGKTLIEKVEHYSGSVQFAVIILTGDDFGGAKGSEELLTIKEKSEKQPQEQAAIKPRARQNVIIEFGYFIGLLGRERVAAIYEEGVELPSDVDGLLYIKYDDSGKWKAELHRELKAAGVQLGE